MISSALPLQPAVLVFSANPGIFYGPSTRTGEIMDLAEAQTGKSSSLRASRDRARLPTHSLFYLNPGFGGGKLAGDPSSRKVSGQ